MTVRCIVLPRRLILSDVQILQAAYTLVHCIQESSCFYHQSWTVCSEMTVTIISSNYCKPSSAIVALHMKVARKPSICENKQYTHKDFCLVQTSPGARLLYSAISLHLYWCIPLIKGTSYSRLDMQEPHSSVVFPHCAKHWHCFYMRISLLMAHSYIHSFRKNARHDTDLARWNILSVQ